MNMVPQNSRAAQRGAVLMIGMVMLIMLTLVALSVIRMSTLHTQVVNNEQLRTEANAAAEYALDLVLNQSFTTWDKYVGAGATELANLGVQATQDTVANSMSVTVSNLVCRRARVAKNSEFMKTGAGGMKYVDAVDSSCFGGGAAGLTIVDPAALGSPTDDSLCANVLYEMQATPTAAALLSAQTTVRQGVEVRVEISAKDDKCI